MSTWTFKITALAAALGLAACSGGFDITRNAPQAVKLPSGVVVSGTRGWCVDETTTRADGDASVVVFGSCAAIAKNALLPRPGVPGVITVSVDNSTSGTAPAEVLDAFFATERGRAALARDGRASSVRILETRQSRNALFLHAVDRSPLADDAAEDYWRAIFDLGGRFVSVSLVGLSEAPIPREEGLRTLEAQIERLRAANS
ncbi:hypothetical protein GQ651_01515 [Alphaproteobacteria bacterium GH1-50]|uniref:Lipoprotein n=1 Tax=Kangsaoukella pontilimi TaxID=2691042 RepID=A0A7C9MDJ2_9RHOB|nr:hypothetical protein [Kangsaoukella pontilimi]MXQ06516.1 hypothetical protein [Kangsaoukella pontilimi]